MKIVNLLLLLVFISSCDSGYRLGEKSTCVEYSKENGSCVKKKQQYACYDKWGFDSLKYSCGDKGLEECKAECGNE